MDLNYSESERLLKDGVRAFLSGEVTFALVDATEKSGELPGELWRRLGAQGWLGVGVGEARGGGGGTLVDWALVLEEMGYACCPLPVAEQLAAAVYFAALPPESPAGALTATVVAGGEIVSVAVEDAPNTSTRLAGGVLTGEKVLIPYGAAADRYVVFAGDRRRPDYRLVARNQPAVSLRALRTQSKDQHVRARFDSAAALALGSHGDDPATDFLALYTLARDAVCVGNLLRILEVTTAYAKERVQFGRPIGSYQAIQYRCVDIALAAHGSQALLYQAAWLVANGRPAVAELAMLHAYVRDGCGEVTRSAHQAHGAIGFTQEYPLQFLTRRVKAYQQTLGSADDHRETLARALTPV